MKRWITAGLALLLCLSVAGCAESTTPEERFEAVMQQAADAASMEFEAQSDIKMGMGDVSMSMTIEMDASMVRTDGRFEMSMSQKVDVEGQLVEAQSYYKDGYLYGSTMGQRYKLPLPIEEMERQLRAQNLQAISASDLDLLKVEREGKGYAITYAIKREFFDNYLDQVIGLVGAGMFPAESIRITSMNGRMLVDGANNLKEQTVRMSLQMDLAGQTMDMAAEIQYQFRNVGGDVTIDFPADLDSYQLVG